MIDGVILASRDLGEFDFFELSAFIVADDETIPEMYDDLYSDEVIAAFYREEWEFVTLGVVASRDGVPLGHAYLSAVEHGWFPATGKPAPSKQIFINALDSALQDEYGLLAEAVDDARKCLASLVR